MSMTPAKALPKALHGAKAVADALRRRFVGDRRGAILVELAVALPVIVVIIIGGFDTGRYVLLHQKMNRAAATMADLVSRPTSISSAEIDVMFSAAQGLMRPFDMAGRGRVIVSSVSKDSGGPEEIDWQYAGGGALSATSAIGVAGGAPTLPDGFTVRDDENLIVAEVFFDYEPVFMGFVVEPTVVRHFAIRRPRRGDLSNLD
ncbi:MAG: TadE/TadG family type IV pilus assembly protein [Kiloniellales bacterium]